MDTRTGRIYPSLTDVPLRSRVHCVEMETPPTARQLEKMRVGRNDFCPCGSGLKFKKCCLRKAQQ